MTRYNLASALPLTGSAGALLTAAISARWPTKLSVLAREAEISKYAASRAATGLIETGLLQIDEGNLYVFNRRHEMSDVLVELAWRYSGIALPPESLSGRFYSEVDSVLLTKQGDSYEVRDHIPKPLRLEALPDLDFTDIIGPDLVTARDAVTRMRRLLLELSSYEEMSQKVYSLWGTERLRDMIHQTLHFGYCLSAASATLLKMCDAEVQGTHDPHDVAVPAWAWVRATYAVSAEARRVHRLIRILTKAVTVGGAIQSHRAEALSELVAIKREGLNSKYTERSVRNAVEEQDKAEKLWNQRFEKEELPFAFIGGIPNVEDVGTAGDKILIVQLANTIKKITDLVARMAAHSSIATWRDSYPEYAAAYPLVTVTPEIPRKDS